MSDQSDLPDEGGSPQNRYRKRRRAELRKQRKVVDGRLVSTHPDAPHGSTEGYDLYACRCDLCTEASNKRSRESRDRQRRDRIVAVLGDSGLVLTDRDAVTQQVLDTWRTSRGDRRNQRIAVRLGDHAPNATSVERLRVADAIVAALAVKPTGPPP